MHTQRFKTKRYSGLTETSSLNAAISSSSSGSSSNSPSSAEGPTKAFASDTSQGGARATTRAPVGLGDDGPDASPIVPSGAPSADDGLPDVPSGGGSGTTGGSGDPPGSCSRTTGSGDGAGRIFSAGATCSIGRTSASSAASTEATSSTAAGKLRQDSSYNHGFQKNKRRTVS